MTKKKVAENNSWWKQILYILVALIAFGFTRELVSSIISSDSKPNANNIQNYSGEWKPFNSVQHGFVIDLPSFPDTESDTLLSDGYSIPYTFYTSASDYEEYLVGVYIYPDELDMSDTKSVLEGMANGAVTNINGTLESTQYTQFNGLDAIDVIGSALYEGDPFVFRAKMFINGNTGYMISAYSAPETSSDFQRMVDSFKFNY